MLLYNVYKYTTKLCENVVYSFSIFHGEVAATNFGNNQMNMSNSPTAVNQSVFKNIFKKYSILWNYLNEYLPIFLSF